MKVSANGIAMHYTLDGPAAAPVVTLSHSLATTLAMWEPQVKALTARWRVLRYDTRGHGGTDAPAGAPTLPPPAAGAAPPPPAPPRGRLHARPAGGGRAPAARRARRQDHALGRALDGRDDRPGAGAEGPG